MEMLEISSVVLLVVVVGSLTYSTIVIVQYKYNTINNKYYQSRYYLILI